MRYVALLLCLWAATMAHAYNETITSIAYNPSRMGAYDYLKINKKLKLKGGFRALGNTTEINLYGNISVVDSTGHNDYSTPENLNMIATIKPLSNYSPQGGYTFCTKQPDWLYNSEACSGSTFLETNRMMGLGPATYHYDGGAIPDTSYLIPKVYVYGKDGVDDIVVSSSSSDYSRIQNIARMYFSGSGSSMTRQTESYFPENLSLTTNNLSAGEGSSPVVQITGTLTLGGVGLNASSAFDHCSSTNTSYEWVKRVTDDHKEVYILACKAP